MLPFVIRNLVKINKLSLQFDITQISQKTFGFRWLRVFTYVYCKTAKNTNLLLLLYCIRARLEAFPIWLKVRVAERRIWISKSETKCKYLSIYNLKTTKVLLKVKYTSLEQVLYILFLFFYQRHYICTQGVRWEFKWEFYVRVP